MADLRRRIQAEVENVGITLRELETAIGRSERATIELAAIATFVHNTYNGIENILKQILHAEGLEVPHQDAWHKAILDRSATARMAPRCLVWVLS